MTEDEMRTKVCHKTLGRDVLAPGGGGQTCVTEKCIGSDCAAWRWRNGFPLKDDPPEIANRFHGYCGLAGPEN
jgi:hypothetical protein